MKEKIGGEKKTKMKKIGIITHAGTSVIAIALVLMILFGGGASAAQTSFSVAVADGTVRTEASITTTTYGGLPFDEIQYKRNVFAIRAAQFTMESVIDSGDGDVEVETNVNYMPPSDLKFIFLDEELKKSRVAEGDNESICYDASVGTRVIGHGLGFGSAAIVDDSNVAYAMNSVGYGSLNMQTYEQVLKGDVNGTFTESVSMDSFTVRNGIWNATAEFTSEITEYPALPDRSESLCRFVRVNP